MFVQQPDTATEPAYKYITAEDLAAYERWCAPHVAVFNPIPTGPLYHYTTGSGLIEIIRSGELWSTQVACLNDSSELLYPINLLRSKVDEAATSPVSLEVGAVLQKIEEGLSEPTIDTEGRFVACFSEDGDDLSQWRAYAGGEGGYAIQFDSLHLRHNLPPTMILGKVEYDEAKQSDFLDDVLDTCLRFYFDGVSKKRAPSLEIWTAEFLQYWANLVIVFAPFIKHPRFAGEREWRLVYHLDDEGISRKRFLQRSSMMSQHVPLRLMMRNDGSPCLPITRVVVGPSRHKEISKISVNDLMRTYGYTARASLTAIPYRVV
jgi:hypothetical protein